MKKDNEIINDVWGIIDNHAQEYDTEPNTYAYYGIGADDLKSLVIELTDYIIRELSKYEGGLDEGNKET